MASGKQIREHMEVVGSDGRHVGIVDRVEGTDRIKLAKADPTAGGRHHFIPCEWVVRVGAHVHLKKTSREAMEQWQVAEPAVAVEKPHWPQRLWMPLVPPRRRGPGSKSQ